MTYKLWENEMPHNNESSTQCPEVEAYLTDESDIAVIIFPGGGYGGHAEHEKSGYAEWFQKNGINAFTVTYRLAPDYRHPAEISDAARAVRFVRANAEKFGISKNKIAVMGSSAGGHLASSISVHFDKNFYEKVDEIDNESCRPDGTILCYPVIDMFEYAHEGSRANLFGKDFTIEDCQLMATHRHVTENTPPAFLWHTAPDAVYCENSLLYATALSAKKVPFELHIYPFGPHGLGLCGWYKNVGQWSEALLKWFRALGWRDPYEN